MFKPKIQVRRDLLEKIKTASATLGCTSIEEFVEKTLETETERVLAQAGKGAVSEKELQSIANKLKGLGYLE